MKHKPNHTPKSHHLTTYLLLILFTASVTAILTLNFAHRNEADTIYLQSEKSATAARKQAYFQHKADSLKQQVNYYMKLAGQIHTQTVIRIDSVRLLPDSVQVPLFVRNYCDTGIAAVPVPLCAVREANMAKVELSGCLAESAVKDTIISEQVEVMQALDSVIAYQSERCSADSVAMVLQFKERLRRVALRAAGVGALVGVLVGVVVGR